VRAGQKLENLQSGNLENLTDKDLEEADKALAFFRGMAQRHCLEPRIVYESGESLEDSKVFWEWSTDERLEMEEGDLKYLAAWIRGEEVDEVDSFRQPNRQTRRALAAQSRGQTLQPQPVEVAEGQPA
jgi:hypothetical protein